jgi:carbonic anhydrase
MKIRFLSLTLSWALLSPAVFAGHGTTDELLPGPPQIHNAIQHVLDSNREFVANHAANYFKPFMEHQTPLVTVVSCSDSRVHMHAIDKHPDNDVFVIRNIGNQVTTAEGSVEYGVLHLHTPLLLIIGHSACGAIKAALGDYSAEPDDIKHELDTIHITKGDEWMKAVITNVNNQVATALKKFAHQVEDGHLAVMGAVYDFRDDLKHGNGKLTVVNLNGETDPAKIKQSPLLQGIEGVSVGTQAP